jgi:hypothetical protein
MTQMLLLDIAPDPVPTGIGITGLILVGIVVLVSVAVVLTGLVFLVKRLTKPSGATTHLVVGDACLNLGAAASSNRATVERISSGSTSQ